MSRHTRPLNRQDYKTLSLAALGGALEFYDFIIFVFFAAVVGELFFPADIPEWLRQVQTFGIFAAGYLARPAGRHYHGALWRSGRAQEDVHPEYSIDGCSNAGDWPAADLRLNGHPCAVVIAADAYFARQRDWAAKCRERGCLWLNMCRSAVSASPAAR